MLALFSPLVEAAPKPVLHEASLDAERAGPAYFGLGAGEGGRWSLYLLLGAP